MSRENITVFFESAKSRPELQQKISELHASVERAAAEALAKLSQEAGTPFTAEEFLGGGEGELSEAEMEGVAGGFDVLEATTAWAKRFAGLITGRK